MLHKLWRAVQTLGLQVAEIRQVFLVEDIIRVKLTDFEVCQKLVHSFFLMEGVLLPEGFNRSTHRHEKFVRAARMAFCELC